MTTEKIPSELTEGMYVEVETSGESYTGTVEEADPLRVDPNDGLNEYIDVVNESVVAVRWDDELGDFSEDDVGGLKRVEIIDV